jgi:hypothetical protein
MECFKINKRISRLLYYPNVYHCVQHSPLPSHINPVNKFICYFFVVLSAMLSGYNLCSCTINFNIILASTATFIGLTQLDSRTACLSNACYIHCPSHLLDTALLITYGTQQKLTALYLLRSFLQTCVAFCYVSTNIQMMVGRSVKNTTV